MLSLRHVTVMCCSYRYDSDFAGGTRTIPYLTVEAYVADMVLFDRCEATRLRSGMLGDATRPIPPPQEPPDNSIT